MKLLPSLKKFSIFLILVIATQPALGLPEEEDESYWENPASQGSGEPNALSLLKSSGTKDNSSTEATGSPPLTSSTSEGPHSSSPSTSGSSTYSSSTSEGPYSSSTSEGRPEEVTDEPTESTDPNTETTDPAEKETTEAPSSSISTSEPASATPIITSSIPPDPINTDPTGDPGTTGNPTLPPLDPPSEGGVSTWAIVSISILISFAVIFTALYFLRRLLIRKRRDDQKRLLRGSISSEGFFYGDGSGAVPSNRFHDTI